MSFAVSISQYRRADAPAVRAIYPEFFEANSRELAIGTFLVARHRGRAIGFVLVVWRREPAYFDPTVTRWGEIEDLHVHEDFRNRGVGTMLVRRVLREARQRRCEAVYLETDDFNRSARRVYERCGFQLHNLVIRYRHPLP